MTNFTIAALIAKTDRTIEELTSTLTCSVLENVSKIVEKANVSQHTKDKEQKTRKFQPLQGCQSKLLLRLFNGITYTHAEGGLVLLDIYLWPFLDEDCLLRFKA